MNRSWWLEPWYSLPWLTRTNACVPGGYLMPTNPGHAHRQAEAMKPGLQHKFANLTLFSPQTCSDDIKWATNGNSISYNTTCPLSNDSDQPAQMRRLIRVIALRWLAKTSKLSLDERWAHMQSCIKCCATAGISDILLAGFIFIKFLATPCWMLVRAIEVLLYMLIYLFIFSQTENDFKTTG